MTNLTPATLSDAQLDALVDRLRTRAGQSDEDAWHGEGELMAADAITQLRALLAKAEGDALPKMILLHCDDDLSGSSVSELRGRLKAIRDICRSQITPPAPDAEGR